MACAADFSESLASALSISVDGAERFAGTIVGNRGQPEAVTQSRVWESGLSAGHALAQMTSFYCPAAPEACYCPQCAGDTLAPSLVLVKKFATVPGSPLLLFLLSSSFFVLHPFPGLQVPSYFPVCLEAL